LSFDSLDSLDSLLPLGWYARWEALFATHADAGRVPGRVIRVDRDRVVVATPSGERPVAARPLPAVGDWVALDTDGPAAAVVDVLPRSSTLTRRDPGRPMPQVLAANLDVVFAVAAADPSVNLRRLERTLALAWETGATPVVVITKPDRCSDIDGERARVEQVALGVEVLAVNGLTGEGVDALRRYLEPNATAVLVGPSGAGKSTVANRLLGGEARLATTEVRAGDRKGRHTTTARHLLTVPGGGLLIDTPGVRALALWEAGDGIATAFSDIEALGADCRFRDCRHAGEPGCAVVGRVDPARLRNWRQLVEEVDPQERRRRARVAQKAYRRMMKGPS
jgi:ribosome biogenesis GTPase